MVEQSKGRKGQPNERLISRMKKRQKNLKAMPYLTNLEKQKSSIDRKD